MEKPSEPIQLDKLCDFFAGKADDQTHREMTEALNNPESPESVFMAGVSETSRQWIGSVLKKKKTERGQK